MYGTTDTNLVMESASPSLFVLAVIAVNVLGAGEESGITSEFCGVAECIYKSQPTNLITINFSRSTLSVLCVLTLGHPCLWD